MQRDKSVDIAKGIGIILVVWGHTFGCCPIFNWIHLFHMPLFFLLSGCFINSNESYRVFFYKKWRTLLVPFISFYLMFLGVKLILKVLLKGDYTSLTYSNFYMLANIDYPLWFIVCLFFAVSFYYLIKKNFKNPFLPIFLLTVIGLIFFYFQIELPLWLSQAFLVTSFLYLGDLYYHSNNRKRLDITILVLTLPVFIYAGIMDFKVNIEDLSIIPNPFIFFASSIGGIALVVIISKLISRFRFSIVFEKLGIYSLFIFALHANASYLSPIAQKLTLFSYKLLGTSPIDINNIQQSDILFGIYKTILSLCLFYIIGILLKKHIPMLWNYNKSTDNFLNKSYSL